MKNKIEKILIILLSIIVIAIGSIFKINSDNKTENVKNDTQSYYEISDIPEYSGEIYIEINNNIPNFTDEDMNLEEDYYSDLEDGRVRNGNDKNKL